MKTKPIRLEQGLRENVVVCNIIASFGALLLAAIYLLIKYKKKKGDAPEIIENDFGGTSLILYRFSLDTGICYLFLLSALIACVLQNITRLTIQMLTNRI